MLLKTIQLFEVAILLAALTFFQAAQNSLAAPAMNQAPTFAFGDDPAGVTWTARETNRNWLSVASSADGTKLVAADVGNTLGGGRQNYGQIYTSTDSGVTWTARETNRLWWSVASSADGTKLVAVVNTNISGQIYTSTDSGVTWTPQAGASGTQWQSVASSADGTKLVAVADRGRIYTSTDSGVTWTARESNNRWRSVASSADGTKLVAAGYGSSGTGGQIYTSTDSGVTWTTRESNRKWQSVASSSDGTKLVAVVTFGLIYTSTDSGATWTPRENNRRWQSVASSADGSKLVAVELSDFGQIYTSRDSGVTWTTQANAGSHSWTSVASSADSSKLVAVAGPSARIYTSSGLPFSSPLTIYENAGLLTVNLTAISAGSTNESSQALTITATSSDTNLILNPTVTYASASTTGSLSFTPVTNAVGTATISVVVTDDGGTVNGGIDAVTNTFVVVVLQAKPANGPPTLARIENLYMPEDSGLRTVTLTGITPGPANESGQALTFTATSSNTGLIPAPTVTYLSGTTGRLSFTPVTNVVGTATVTVVVTDDGGTVHAGINAVTNTFVVVVSPVNDAPSFSLPPSSNGSGKVVAWGNSLANVLVELLIEATAIAVGEIHNLALKSDGTVVAWGNNDFGQTNVPDELNGVMAVACGFHHSLALKNDGTVVAWGSNEFGQTNIPVGLSNVVAISSGDFHSLALKGDGTVVAWGDNTSGQANVPVALNGLSAIAAGRDYSLALKSDGTVVAWGDNSFGQTNVPVGLNNVRAIAAGVFHCLALKEDGTVAAWGDNTFGQASVPFGLNGVKAIAAGGVHSLALKTNGTVVAWGDNSAGQLKVPAGLSGVTAIACGGNNSLALVEVLISTVLEDSSMRTIELTSLTPGPSDENLQLLNIAAVSSDTALIPHPVVDYTGGSTGVLRFTPVADANGAVTISVVVQDNGGTANGGIDSVTNTFIVVITSVNDPPTLARIENMYVPEDSGLRTVTLTGITPGPANESGQTLTFAATSSDTGLISTPTVTCLNGTTGSLSFTPVTNATGIATITVIVTDNGGTANGGVNAVTNQFTVTVLPVNNPPTLAPVANMTVIENSRPTSVTLTGISAGPVGESGQYLNLTATSSDTGLIPHPIAGYTQGGTTGSLSFSTFFHLFGTATITVVLRDNGGTENGGVDAVTNTFTITVAPLNDAPTIDSISSVTVLEDSGMHTVNLTGLTPGPANESGQTLTVTATSSDTGIIASPTVTYTNGTTGSLTFAPLTNANGTVNISVVVRDNGGTANGGVDAVTNTFRVFVQPVNDAPSFQLPPSKVVAWGDNDHGQTSVPTELSGVRAICAGFYHSLALKNDGAMVAWGYNLYGQTNVPIELRGVAAIAAGYGHSLALKSNGTVVAWGLNNYGQTIVPGGLHEVTAIDAGADHSLALKSNGTVVAWGLNSFGQTNVPIGLSGVTAISAGSFHNLALKSDGTIVAWGHNGYGETSVPIGLNGVAAISADVFHSLALKSNGTVVAWGINDVGQTNVPDGLSDVMAIAAGGEHSLALKSDGTIVAWGYNGYGQTNVPVGLNRVTAIAAGGEHSLTLVDPSALTVSGDAGPQKVSAFATNISAGSVNESGQILSFIVSNNNKSLFAVPPAIDVDTGNLTFTPAVNGSGTATVSVVLKDNGGTINGETDTSMAQTFTITVTSVSSATRTLTIEPSDGATVISWPAQSQSYQLQNSPDLRTWSNFSIAPTVINGRNRVTNSVPINSGFYRLIRP